MSSPATLEGGHAVDVSTLRAVTEDLAGFLSEVTGGDLGRPTPWIDRDVGDLYLHLLAQNLSIAADLTGGPIPRGEWPDPRDRAGLDAAVNDHGGGLEVGYRCTARLLTDAFGSAPDRDLSRGRAQIREEIDVPARYETQISTTVLHSWDLARALGLPYQPAAGVSQRVLRAIVMSPDQTRASATPNVRGPWPAAIDDSSAFAGVLELAGRTL